MTFGVNSRTEKGRGTATLISRPTRRSKEINVLDCLNVLCSIVMASRVRVRSLLSGVVTMVDLPSFCFLYSVRFWALEPYHKYSKDNFG